MKCLVLANGVGPKTTFLTRLVRTHDLFIAADGAANKLIIKGPTPNVVLGDFDSLDGSARSVFKDAKFVHALNQDASDLEKAIEYALTAGATNITLTGTMGGRIDHSLISVSLLVKFSKVIEITIQEQDVTLYAVRNSIEIHGAPGDILSLIAYEHVSDVRIDGVRWRLKGETLSPSSRGVSNKMTGNLSKISVGSGVLVACHIPD